MRNLLLCCRERNCPNLLTCPCTSDYQVLGQPLGIGFGRAFEYAFGTDMARSFTTGRKGCAGRDFTKTLRTALRKPMSLLVGMDEKLQMVHTTTRIVGFGKTFP